MSTAQQVDALWNGLRDNNGNPLAGGKVHTYVAGTTTPSALYTDAAKSSSATNPVVLDAYGRALVFGDGNYKFVVTDSDDTTLYTIDNLYYSNKSAEITDLEGEVAYAQTMDYTNDTDVITSAVRYDTRNIRQRWNGTTWVTMPIVVPNASFYQGRNQADNADINLIGVSSGNNTQVNALSGEDIEWTIGGTVVGKVDSLGRQFVNTTTVRNSSNLSIDFDGNTAGGIGINDLNSVNASPFIGFLTGNTFRGSITNNNNAAVAYNTTSDYRLKNDIQDVPEEESIERVKKARMRSFTWQDGRRDRGFIAHELQDAIPEAVTGQKDAVTNDGDPIYQGVDPRFCVPDIMNALKSILRRLEALESK